MPYISVKDLEKLKEIASLSAWDTHNCSFGNAEKTADIIESTRLYRDTWMTFPLHAIIRRVEKKD